MSFRKTFRADDDLLARCEEEPIHIPGTIQPHGALLAIEPEHGRVNVASENCEAFLGMKAESLIGRRFDTILGGEETFQNLRQHLMMLQPRAENRTRVPMQLTGLLESFDTEVSIAHDGRVVIEIENPDKAVLIKSDTCEYSQVLQSICDQSAQLSDSLHLDATYNEVAGLVRSLTGYDRVMVYKMDSSGHGRVIAEQKKLELEGFLGLHFPATDIPQRARQLYVRNRVRHLAKIDYEPVPLFPLQQVDDPNTLDLSLSHLRSFSPVHREYLSNMQVEGTLVISLIKSGQLWGLIACHHYSPLHIPLQTRVRCNLLAHMLSALIEATESKRALVATRDAEITAKRLHKGLRGHNDWQLRLLNHQSVLLGQMYANGFAIVCEGEVFGVGQVPTTEQILEIIERLSNVDDENLSVSCKLSEDVAGFPEDDACCGCLKLTISASQDIHLIWFRPEHAQQVSWAGDPHKTLVINNDDTRLSPRKSFEKWNEQVRYESLPWELEQIALAQAIATIVSERKIEETNRLKNQFLANMSHEIRTPLTAIMGFADLLSEQLHCQDLSNPTGSCASSIQTIRRNAQHLLSIIDDILDVARIEAGTIVIVESVVDIATLVKDISTSTQAWLKDKSIDFSVSIDPNVPESLLTDGTRLRQILLNLLHNAVKFTDKGTIQLNVSRCSQVQESYVVFQVRDSGIGLSASQVARLFAPFVQAEDTMNRRFGGTGLGLSISKRIANLLSGQLTLEHSQLGSGSCFRLALPIKCEVNSNSPSSAPEIPNEPVAESEIAEIKDTSSDLSNASVQSADQSQVESIHRQLRVLLAEDSIDNQRLISHLLKKRGFEVHVVENGELALNKAWSALCGGHMYDLILMDMQMPVMDGYEATRALRSRGYEGPIIAVTAHAMAGDSRACIDAGCDAYTTKPIIRDEFFSLIDFHTARPSTSTAPAAIS